MLDDWEHWSITASDGVPSVCLPNCLYLYVIPLYVLFIVSRNNWDLKDGVGEYEMIKGYHVRSEKNRKRNHEISESDVEQ